MSTRYEGAAAVDTTAEWERPGARIGDESLEPGQYALVLGYDEVFYLVGNPRQLRDFMVRLDANLQEIEAHAEGYYINESKARSILAEAGMDFSQPGEERSPLTINETLAAVTDALGMQSR
jgi:hypothetical protein